MIAGRTYHAFSSKPAPLSISLSLPCILIRWGRVDATAQGRLAAITVEDKSGTVNFPAHPGWNGLLAELEYIDEAECTRDSLPAKLNSTFFSSRDSNVKTHVHCFLR